MDNTVRELEVTLDELKDKKSLMDDLDQLHRSPAFKRVILKGLFETRAQELAKMANQAQLNDLQEKIWLNGLNTISGLQAYFHAIYMEGAEAATTIGEYEAALTEERGA